MSLHLRELHFNLGGVLHQQGRYGEAAEHYRRSIHLSQGLNPTSDRTVADAYHSLGIALGHQGQWQHAIACYRAALTLKPNHGAIYISLGIALAQCQRLEEAIAAYRIAVSHCADVGLAHYYLGKAWQISGNHRDAVSCFWQAHRLDPQQTLALNDLLVSLAELGRWDEMTQPLQAIAALPDMQRVLLAYLAAHPDYINADSKEDDVAQARWQCAQFLQALYQQTEWKPLLAKALWHWGNVLMSHGRQTTFGQAEMFYQQAIALQPQSVDYDSALVRCLALQNRREAAVVAAHWGLLHYPNHPALLAHLGDRATTPAAVSQASPAAPTATAQTPPPCEGLNCISCLQEIYQSFNPTHLGRGVFCLSGDLAPANHKESPPFIVLPHGRAWVATQQHPWQACHAIAVFDQTDTLQPEVCRDYPGQLPNCKRPYQPIAPSDLPPAQQLKGTVALLSGLSGHVYFHWMIDIVPRVIALQSIQTEPIDWFVINSVQKPFQRETLQQLGVPSERIVESDRHPHIQADRLVVPPFTAPLGWPTHHAIQSLRRHFLPSRKPTSTYPKQIYITRSGARYRRVLNEAAVIAQLQSVGVTPVDLEQLSVAQQADLFANATLIVAPHGSGLTNLVFCQPGATVIELLSSNYVRHYYWPISQLCHLRHFTVVSPGLPCFLLRLWMYLNPLAEDIWVDESSLQRALQVALPSQPQPPLERRQPSAATLAVS